MDNIQSTIQQMVNEDKQRDTFKLLTSLIGLKLNREQVHPLPSILSRVLTGVFLA